MNLLSTQFYSLKTSLQENPKKVLFSFLFFIGLLLLLLLMMLFGRTSIRQSQIEALVDPQITSKQVLPLGYKKEGKKIKESKAISILFAKPSLLKDSEVLKLIKQKEAELNRSIYVYPLVYQAESLAKKYQLNLDETTFVFFEKGIEKNRFTFESVENPEKNFIPELNRLPMWNIKVIESEESTGEAVKDSNEG